MNSSPRWGGPPGPLADAPVGQPGQRRAGPGRPAADGGVRPTLPPLILFDIDGTLVRRAGPHHRQALVDAIRDVTGLETTTDGIPVHGMLDPDILRLMMRAAGWDDGRIASVMPAVIDAAEDIYEGSVP